MEDTQLSSVLENLFNPVLLPDFKYPMSQYPKIVYHSSLSSSQEMNFTTLYPFLTVQDLKTLIYIVNQKQTKFHPSYQSLLIADPLNEGSFIPLDFAFVNSDKKEKILSTYSLINPFLRAVDPSVDTRFVTSAGDQKIITISDRSNSTLEDILPQLFGSEEPVLHLFLFNDILEAADETTILSKREWNGRIYPYFPEVSEDYDALLEDPEERRYLNARITNVESTIEIMDQLDQLVSIEAGQRIVQLKPIRMLSLKFLRIVWKKPFREVPDVETLFYQFPVTYLSPFLRILPAQGVPISKLFVESALRIPSFDPRLIPQWAEQRGPSRDDFLFGKVVIRDKDATEPALFGTLRIFEDRSADFILQPPKNLKKLMLRDVSQFPSYLSKTLEDTYLHTNDVDIGEAAVICGVPIGLKQVSKQQFLRRLKAFGPLFQEIPPLPNEQPLVMLRYRAVSKFSAEDKIFTFITQYTNRKVANGEEIDAQEIVTEIMDTFKVRFSLAKKLFAKWGDEKAKITLNIAETKDFVLQYNKGIDIAVFAQQATYTFHLYRVDSALHLRRILTALSLLLSAEDEDLNLGSQEDLTEAQSIIDDDEKNKEVDETNVLDEADGFWGVGVDEEEEPDESQVAEAPPVASSLVAKATKPKPVEMSVNDQKKTLREYFTKRLYDIDPELFPTTEGSMRSKAAVKTKVRSDKKQTYSIKCQSADDRQPVGLTEEEYESMLEIYKNDDIVFLEFPLKEGQTPSEGPNVIPVLKYGSSSLKMNYYVCSELFCIRDFLVILKKDFEGRKYRSEEKKDEVKEPNTCPFCGGKEINKKNPGPNETVYRRKDNNKNKYVKLLQNTVHPQGLFQPCCFGSFPKYTESNPQFAHLKYRERTEEEEEKEEEETTFTTGARGDPLNYALTLYRTHKKYIVEKNRIPLHAFDIGGPQIGLLLPILDPYFQQNDEKIVHTPQQRQVLKPDSKAFLRVGVDNSQLMRNESFFSAIAPFIDGNTADDVRRKILERIDPRNFLYFNYGNLLLEFYNPADARPMDTELRLWSQKNLEVELADTNKDAILRLWKSYHRFLDFLNDKTEFKEYRQFAQMLATPGFLTVRGIVFIVLDVVKDGDNEKLEVRCPPYGYDNEQFANADIGFLLHHHSGIWEPIFYSENKLGTSHSITLKFQRSLLETWPEIVRKRVVEFTNRCSSPGRAAWTSQSGIDSFSLIPLSRAIQGMSSPPEGIIRDAYNHIVALTFRVKAGKSRLVALPVVDDGTIITPLRLHFDWDDYSAATLEETVTFYRENVEPYFGYYQGYSTRNAVRDDSLKRIVAVQLKNGIYIPVSKAEKEPTQYERIERMEWSINRDIIFGEGMQQPDLETNEEKLNEAFEHLRLSFSNWLSSEQVSGDLRDTLQKIVFAKDLPLFEKRKRLEILLGPTLLEWMDDIDEFRDEQKSLLRVDCRLRTESQCSSQCIWNQSKGKCMIHVPQDDAIVNVPLMLVRRLFEELLRYPERRMQLLEKKVSPLVSLKQALYIDNQYIVPDSSMAWYDLLRTDLTQQIKERSKFFEEQSSVATAPVYVPREEKTAEGAVPELLIEIFGSPEESNSLYLYRPELTEGGMPSMLPFLISLGVFPEDLGIENEDLVLSSQAVKTLVSRIRQPVIQVDVQSGNLDFQAIGPSPKREKSSIPIILIAMDIDEGGPALLSLSPERPIPVPIERLPSGLKFLYDEREIV